MGGPRKLFLTGASGLLGRAVYKTFLKAGWVVFGTAFTRVGPGLHKVDLTKRGTVEDEVSLFQPDVVIHCAAQRFPDKVDADPTAAEKLNVACTQEMAYICNAIAVPLLYISTDYVFDGKSPPYSHTAEPNPLNFYGKTKREGEIATIEANPRNIILRIPVIYGPVERLDESAVTVLLENLLNFSTPSTVSNYERRCPSSVDDIGNICLQLATKCINHQSVSGIFHWCGKEVMTKYDMVLQMADVFKLPHEHIQPASAQPGTSTTRPFDTEMDTSRLDAMHIGTHTLFKQGIKECLQSWVPAPK